MMDSLDFEALRSIGLAMPLLQQLPAMSGDESASLMRVVEVQREHLLLHDGLAEKRGRLASALVHRLQSDDDAVAVGDWVLAQADAASPASSPALIVDRLAPLTQLARRVNDGRGSPRRQILVSNIDTALLVMGLDHDFNLRRLERYLALVRLAAVDAVLVLTKADVAEPAQVARRVAQARECLPLTMSLCALDARDARSAAALKPWADLGQTLVLLGSSGAGKSTLTNTLTGQVSGEGGQFTGAVRADDSRGRHTTTVRTLRRIPGGACIIDTPGLRALRLDVGDEEQLGEVFGDVAQWAAKCRFRDCRHQQEPGCAVREAVPAERLRNFQKLVREARRDTMTALERRDQLAAWKARGREGSMRAKAKRNG